MKARGILKTYTEDNQVLQQRVPIKLDRYGQRITATFNGKKSMFFLPLIPDIDIGKPIWYAITDPQPLDSNFTPTKDEQPPISKKYLIVTIK